MWYNAMISLGIIGVLTSLPAYVSPYVTKFFIGNPNGRTYKNSVFEQMTFLRDYEFGDKKIWKLNGLEVIPDK